MATEVEHAYWHWWQAGKNVQPSADDQADYEKYIRKAGRANSYHRLLLLAMAADAWPIEDVFGESYKAICFSSIATLAERIGRSRSTTIRLLRELDEWGELTVEPCNGHCTVAKNGGRHAGTNHYGLPLPAGAQPWGRKEKRHYGKTKGRARRKDSATGA